MRAKERYKIAEVIASALYGGHSSSSEGMGKASVAEPLIEILEAAGGEDELIFALQYEMKKFLTDATLHEHEDYYEAFDAVWDKHGRDGVSDLIDQNPEQLSAAIRAEMALLS
jgi:hypothetical protein